MRRLTAILASITLAAGALLFAGSPAQAASCSGTSCDSRNPESTGCSAGAYTYATASLGYPWKVELRRSTTCNAYWARVQNYYGSGYVNADLSVDRYNSYIGVISYQSTVAQNDSTVAYTNMWGRQVGHKFRACISLHQGLGSTCTAWYS